MLDTTKTAEEYSDILLSSIDTLITASLNTLQFDKTITCIIEDASQAANGLYAVTDGTLTF
jgi:hypothetical protein